MGRKNTVLCYVKVLLIRNIKYSLVFRSSIVKSALSLPDLAPRTRSTSQCPNSCRSLISTGSSSMLRPSFFLLLLLRCSLVFRLGFTGRLMFFNLLHILCIVPNSYWTSSCCADLSKRITSCDFCSSDRRFAYTFLQIPPHDRHTWCSATSFPLLGLNRDFHLGAHKKARSFRFGL